MTDVTRESLAAALATLADTRGQSTFLELIWTNQTEPGAAAPGASGIAKPEEVADAILAALPSPAPEPPLPVDRLAALEGPLRHGYSPRPLWAGRCPDCGAAAGENCAILTEREGEGPAMRAAQPAPDPEAIRLLDDMIAAKIGARMYPDDALEAAYKHGRREEIASLQKVRSFLQARESGGEAR